MKCLLVLCFFYSLCSTVCWISGEAVLDSEKSILLKVKTSFSDPSGILSSWSPTTSDHHCSWFGVSCNAESRVVSLTICGENGKRGNFQAFSFSEFSRFQFRINGSDVWRNTITCENGKLRGKLCPLLGRLTELRVLSLPSNELSGGIPFEIWGLEKLEVLDLEGNWISGTLPSLFTGLRKLKILNLGFNRIYGEVPISLSKCRSLQVLNLAGNAMNGTIPEFIGDFPMLQGLYLSQNRLSGAIPGRFGSNCCSLEHLDLSGNFLLGNIPDSLGNCQRLRTLLLFSNRLNGSIPRDFGRIRMLEVFDVSRNSLYGPIPPELGQCFNLSVLVLSNLFNPLPSKQNLGGDSSVKYSSSLQDDYNHFEGSIPIGITALLNLKIFWAPRVNLKGILQSNWGACENLEMVNLAQNFFKGDMSGVFKNCMKLHYLNVSNNKLSGHVPSRIGVMFRSLRFLDASGNVISGSLPQSLGDLTSLVFLDLSRNKLQGQIPESMHHLKYVKYLSMAFNNLTGTIPDSFGCLHSLEVLDLSSNSLSGDIPNGLAYSRNVTILLLDNDKLSTWIHNESFNSLSRLVVSKNNVMNCSGFHPCPTVSLTTSYPNQPDTKVQSQNNNVSSSRGVGNTENNGLNTIEIASIVSSSLILLVFLALLVFFFYTRRWISNSKIQGSEIRDITVFTQMGRALTFEGIVQATGNFSSANCIGNGGFGATYKAEISPGVTVAVKRLAVGRVHGIEQFHAEVKTLGMARHPNLVTLVGYHVSETEMFLIYNYLPGGNLESFIKERSKRAINWKIIHKISLDIALALSYLHDQCNPRVLHRDVKPSNILLDDDFSAYLSDFGLSRLLGTSETHVTTGVAGTFGYVAPEYALTCRVSEKSDVYSYGVVILELISDKKALDPSFYSHQNGFNIVSWASMLLRQGRSKEVFTAGLWDAGDHDDLIEILHIAITCTDETLCTRPTMKQVVERLKSIQPS